MRHFQVSRKVLGRKDLIRFRIAAERPGIASSLADTLKMAAERTLDPRLHTSIRFDPDLIKAARTYL